MLSVVLGALFGAVTNRFSGSENIEWIPGRNVYYAIVAVTIAGYLAAGPWFAAALFISCALYRLPGWFKSIDMGKNDGSLSMDFGVMFVRTMCMFPVFFYAFAFMGAKLAIVYLIIASFLATVSYVVGNYFVSRFVKDPFVFIEAAAGAAIGAAVGGLISG